VCVDDARHHEHACCVDDLWPDACGNTDVGPNGGDLAVADQDVPLDGPLRHRQDRRSFYQHGAVGLDAGLRSASISVGSSAFSGVFAVAGSSGFFGSGAWRLLWFRLVGEADTVGEDVMNLRLRIVEVAIGDDG
jgi:hypothetical protein